MVFSRVLFRPAPWPICLLGGGLGHHHRLHRRRSRDGSAPDLVAFLDRRRDRGHRRHHGHSRANFRRLVLKEHFPNGAVVSHWANKEPTLSVKLIVEMVFVILVMGMMEGSENTSDIATLFAYLLDRKS